jgi:hypothetical protein
MISVGFIVMPQFQQFIRRQHCQDDDGRVACGDNDDWILDHQDKCLPMSLWLEFFQIASESWLLCITYDLVVTNYSTRSTLDRHFSFGRSRRGSEALLDVEIPPRGTLNDQPELSQTVTVVQEKGSIFQRFLRYLPCLLPLSLALIDAPATGPQDSSFTRTVTRLSLKNFFLSALLRSARIVTSNTSIESTPPLPSLSSLLSFTTTP